MRYLIAGLGSIGKRHLHNIVMTDPGATITVWHTHSQKRGVNDQASPNIRSVYSFDDAIDPKPDAAFVTTPASEHIPCATKLAHEGIDLFIEKPLSSSLHGVDDLLAIQNQKNTIIMVGYNLRFHKPLQILKKGILDESIGRIIGIRAEAGQYLPEWRPGSDYRLSGSARNKLGGGAVLELSHELDYVRWLAGEVASVTARTDHLSDLEMDVEDTADIILKHTNGIQGSIHLDMVQRFPMRYCKVVGTEGTLVWKGTTDSVMMYSARTSRWSELLPAKKIDRNQMYLAELRHFLSCIRERKGPLVSCSDGKRVVEIALAALQSSREGRSVTV